MDCLWSTGGKAWKYEYKYRRGGKTLCALYARENCVGFMIVLGKDERLKFEIEKIIQKKFKKYMTKLKFTMMVNGSCLSRWILLYSMISLGC